MLPADAGPLMFAESLLAVHENEDLRSAMICAGIRRIDELNAASNTSLTPLLEQAGLLR